MARRKSQIDISKLSDKEILIAFCNNLGDASCKKAYKLLMQEFNIDRSRLIRLNKNGVIDDGGLLRIKSKQYDKMLNECSEYKYKWLIGCLYEYVEYLKEKAELGDLQAKQKLKTYTNNSCYPNLMSGWVMDKYKMYGARNEPPREKRMSLDSVRTLDDAIKYINSIPQELLMESPELEYLASKYPEIS